MPGEVEEGRVEFVAGCDCGCGGWVDGSGRWHEREAWFVVSDGAGEEEEATAAASAAVAAEELGGGEVGGVGG